MKTHAKERPTTPRCPYCWDEPGEDAVRCSSCGVEIHAECLAELRSCPALGCGVAPREFVDPGGERLGELPPAPGVLAPWKLALRRSLLLGLAFVVPFAAVPLLDGDTVDGVAMAFTALTFGLIAFPAAAFELRAARREQTGWPWQVFASAASGAFGVLIAMSGFLLAVPFWHHLLKGHPLARVASGTAETASEYAGDPALWAAALIAGASLSLVVGARMRNWRLKHQVGLSLVGTGLIAALLHLMIGPTKLDSQLALMTGIGSISLPIAAWLSDSIPWPAWLPSWLADSPRRRAEAAKTPDPKGESG